MSGAQYRTAGYPPKYNDPALVQMGFRSAIELFKEEDGSADIDKIILNDESTALGGEDFAFFFQSVVLVFATQTLLQLLFCNL